MRIRLYLIFILLLSSKIAMAQYDIIIIGQVFDAEDGMPLQGAKVSFYGGKISTLTNEEGYFYLNSPQIEKSIYAEMLGYKSQKIKINTSLRDQSIDIIMSREDNILETLLVSPTKDKMRKILSEFDRRRAENSPDRLYGFQADSHTTDKIYMSGITRRLLEKRLFSEIKNGVLFEKDSSIILPVHFSETLKRTFFSEGKDSAYIIKNESNTLDLFGKNTVKKMLDAYIPKADFYKNNLSLFGKLIPSPTSKNGLLYYKYTIIDSISPDNSLIYKIRFQPKHYKSLALKGTMWIDASRYALLYIEAEIPQEANLNFLKDISFTQTFSPIDDKSLFPTSNSYTVSFFHQFAFSKNKNYMSAILNHKEQTYNFKLQADSIKHISYDITLQDEQYHKRFSSAIDTINASKLQKTATYIADVLLNGYIHAGAVDIGIIYDMLRWNKVEGFRPTISLRTSERLFPYFSVGGYFGYGIKDRLCKYGANLLWQFGHNKRNSLGIHYSNDVMHWGYASKSLLNENAIGSGENLLTSFSWGGKYDYLHYYKAISATYAYEKPNFKFAVEPNYTSYTFPTNYNQDYFTTLSIKIQTRLSWDEDYAEGFFRKFYLPTYKPIISFESEAGKIYTDNQHFYGKFTLALKHTLPTTIGKFAYSILASKILGSVPLPLLIQPMTMQGIWYNNHNFMLVSQGEFFADTYASAFFRYYSQGFLFNLVPWINKLNLRETIFLQAAYGSLSDHYVESSFQKLPYIEAGCGITNIFKFLAVEAVWRLTYRNHSTAPNWGIRAKFYLDF